MTGDKAPQLSCIGLWKLYGPDPAGFLARHDGQPTQQDMAREGYIGACRNLSFKVTRGEILVIMGLSGSGKSTLVRCLARLIEPSGGQVMFGDEDITKASAQRLIALRRKQMGMVFQNFGLLPHRNALRNVSFPLEMQGMNAHEAMEKARNLLSLVGLQGREGYFPHEMSGGQQQRIGIARSLASDPDLWFLDEPFSALDPLIRREMQDEFLRLQRLLKKTIVFITHDFDEAVRVASRIGIMKDGELVQLGTPEELVRNPANDYVREFTRTAPRAKLISVQTIMQSGGNHAQPGAAQVPGAACLEAVAPVVLRADAAVDVLDDDGRIIGQITRERLIHEMFDHDQPNAKAHA